MITNNTKLIKQVGDLLNIEIPKKLKHLWNQLPDVPIRDRMRVLGKKYPDMPAILIFSEIITHDDNTQDYKAKVFKNDYKIMRQYVSKERDCIFFFTDEDYIRFEKGKVINRVGNGVSKFIDEITGKRFNPIFESFQEHFGDLREYLTLYAENNQFRERVEYLFSVLDTDVSIVKSIMNAREVDVFIFKLMNVLQFLKDPDPMFIRQFKGNPNERRFGIEPDFEVNTLMNYLKEFTDVKIQKEDIYIEVEESYYDDEFINYLGIDNPIKTPEEEYEENPHA